MSVILFGASPWGTRALTRLGVDYHLVVPPGEDVTVVHGAPHSVTYLPFVTDPEVALAAPCPPGATAAISFTEPGLLPAALLASGRGLAGTSVAGVASTRNKLAMRRALDGIVPQPRYGQVGVDPVPPGLESVVVKPQSGTAGLGVSLVPSSALADRAPTGEIWEEQVSGREFSIETVSRVVDGALDVEVVGITAKGTSGPPDFVELNHSVPPLLSDAARAEMLETVRRCLERLDVGWGAAHTELMLTSDRGPVLIELQTRPGGGRIPSLHELASGVDHYEAALRALLDLPRAPRRTGAALAAARMLMAPVVGPIPDPLPRLDHVDVDAAATLVAVEVWRDRGAAGTDTLSNLDRYGVVVAAGQDPAAVTQLLDQTAGALATPPLTAKEIPA